VLRSWLSEADHRTFTASRAAAAPHACIAALPSDVALFDWDTLDRVLTAKPPPDALVVRKSELLTEPAPTGAPGVRALFQRGSGVVVRRAERHDRELARVARAFADELVGSAHIQLFVTPAATHGFGWHYDDEDVCILQTVGTKTYYFRANTLSPAAGERPGQPDFSRVREEKSPTMTCTLAPRDMLYLPRRMWHVARADTDSLSVSIGVR
jgi:hypothetical protein